MSARTARPALPLLLGWAVAGSAAGQGIDWSQVQNPNAPQVQAAAREALSRAVVRELRGKVLNLNGLQSTTSGRVADLDDIASELAGTAPGLTARVSGTELRLNIPDQVLFDFDKSTLRPEAQSTLQAVAAAARRAGDLPVRVEGHTDAKGAEAYNQRLSEARALAVEAWLQGAGLPDARVSARGFGPRNPVAPNTTPDGRDNPEGRQKNRRVEIVIGG